MATLLKLINGEEIIGEIENTINEQYIIGNPLLIEITSDDSGMHGMILVNYCPFSDVNTISIDIKNVVASYKVNDSLQEYYEKSIVYCRKYHDLRFSTSIATAISYLDNILEKIDEPKKTKREKLNLKIFVNPNSNTVN